MSAALTVPSTIYLPPAIANDTCFHIPKGSVNNFTTISSLQSDRSHCDTKLHPNVRDILNHLTTAPSTAKKPHAPASLNVIDDPNKRIDIFHTTSLKLSQLSSIIDPIVKFHKKCSGNGNVKSQLPAEVYNVDDLRQDPSISKRGVVYSENASLWTTDVGSYYIPERSLFYWGDVRVGLRSICSLNDYHLSQLQHDLNQGNQNKHQCKLHLHHHPYKRLLSNYNNIVLDPPWRNKSARRGRRYQMGFSNKDLLNLGPDLKTVMNPEGCLIAVWVTNSNNFQFVKDTLFPKWGVQFTAVWWWLKVNASGDALHASVGHKKSYERIVIGYFGPHSLSTPSDLATAFSLDHPESLISNEQISLQSTHSKRKHSDMLLTYSLNESRESEAEFEEQERETPSVFLNRHAFKDCATDSSKCDSSGFSASWYHLFSDLTKSESFSTTTFLTSATSKKYSISCQSRQSSQSPSHLPFPKNSSDGESFNFPVEVIVSVPIRHSWKPPLQHLLQQSLKTVNDHYTPTALAGSFSDDIKDPSVAPEVIKEGVKDCGVKNCGLEIFARELRRDCTSIGNEVLLLQTMDDSSHEEGPMNCNGFLRLS
eukprot:CAMPEP_0114430028 /NCGR_PEP_ID=MMETSP0103-20121206/9814_1 /TAXON_ID=37642 ORGANISM="Paraphysomonas imperforata, Strain PA2" /NCGR_SAMPLE_ID=MMETSP0103 /ASSEMBLY_ACC=CAM_ASM_000201 /LENGTH=593 /DNA_ID=CAMNT_0001599431 /DNA_START=201 /DNA_END=1981 /DNA_ORIENTATION=-